MRHISTTPFGRRPMSLGMLASQQLAETIEPGEHVTIVQIDGATAVVWKG